MMKKWRFSWLIYRMIVLLQSKRQRIMLEASTSRKQTFTPFQIQMLELMSHVQSEDEMNDIRRMLAEYFAKRAEDAIDQLWDEGVLNDNMMEEWKSEHMRTHYRE